jgi:hypothetical protein
MEYAVAAEVTGKPHLVDIAEEYIVFNPARNELF